ncbi:2Fe-2S iron-sulfur cluster-binding protein [Bacillus benzoevorans]|uniref:Ferredoxin n=1 Tax=Bacillus benzoevorans TaxID=1456 RepID=A0A7X0LTW3_9BACI|nr:2Fe-2S iron-sulfur cluster-binding protein [Bacillus benzoevorans]MBB6443923.1 ferredoxin [Bacillus benzoevorans]
MNEYKIKVSHPDERTFTGNENENILDASIRTHGGIKVGCKRGGCGLCKIKVVEGEIKHGAVSRSVLPLQEEEEGYALACRAMPKSDITIEDHSAAQAEKFDYIKAAMQAAKRAKEIV